MMKNAVENDPEFDKPLPLNSFKHLGIFFNKDSANKHVNDHLFISHKYCDLFFWFEFSSIFHLIMIGSLC